MKRAVQQLRKIWKKYNWKEYNESTERKRETAMLWERFSSSERIEIIKAAYGR